MREDLRHSLEESSSQLNKIEFGDGETERNARRAAERVVNSKGIKKKYLGKKNIFKK